MQGAYKKFTYLLTVILYLLTIYHPALFLWNALSQNLISTRVLRGKVLGLHVGTLLDFEGILVSSIKANFSSHVCGAFCQWFDLLSRC